MSKELRKQLFDEFVNSNPLSLLAGAVCSNCNKDVEKMYRERGLCFAKSMVCDCGIAEFTFNWV